MLSAGDTRSHTDRLRFISVKHTKSEYIISYACAQLIDLAQQGTYISTDCLDQNGGLTSREQDSPEKSDRFLG